MSFVVENGTEVHFVFTDGSKLRLEWVDDNGTPVKGKVRVKSAGTHIVLRR